MNCIKTSVLIALLALTVVGCRQSASPFEDLTDIEKLEALRTKHVNVESVDTFKTVLLQGILLYTPELEKYLSKANAQTLPVIKNLYSFILAAAEAARVYILPRGCIEHYYVRNDILFMPVPGKDRLFHAELEHITTASPKLVRRDYSELIAILEKALARS